MSSRSISSTSLVKQESVQFIRAQNIVLKVKNARPNTRMFVFFDEVDVTHLCSGGSGAYLTSDENGVIEITFSIPSGTFTTGSKQVIVADTDDLNLVNIPGTVNGSARGVFVCTGRIDFYQTTETEIVDKIIEDLIYVPPAPPPNPPAVNASYGIYQEPEQYVEEVSRPFTLPLYIDNPFESTILRLGYDYQRPIVRGVKNPQETPDFLALGGVPGLVELLGVDLDQYGGVRRETSAYNAGIIDTIAHLSLYQGKNYHNDYDLLRDAKSLYEENLKNCKTQDPLAQSFFTYGFKNGIFVSSIELFFRTKDASVPVRVEIRPLVNGYPADLPPNNPSLVSWVSAADVKVSQDASVPTRFSFVPPVYLDPDKDYCFVVLSNCLSYNLFTSKMGEVSLENGKIIFDQPFIGSLFKSENNITWTAEQFEDIKFNLYRAKFDTSQSAIIDLITDVPQMAAPGNQFYTVEGSTTITYYHPQEHGLEVGSKFACAALPGAIYNGIPGESLTGTFDVISVPNRNIIKFNVSGDAPATSTGRIESANIIVKVDVDSGGANYNAANTTIEFSYGDAEAEPIISNGSIVGVKITNPGTGYTTPPQVIVNSTTGNGAALVALTDAMFTVSVNKPMTEFTPSIKILNFGDTTTRSVIQTTIGNFDGGNLTTYDLGKQISFFEKELTVPLRQNSLIASRFNEFHKMADAESGKITVELNSTDDRVSPIIDLKQAPEIWAYSAIINNQPGETLESEDSTASIDTIIVTAGGSGYTIAPIVNIIGNGTGATATATLTSGVVTSITVTNAGTGFTQVPIITITRAPGDDTGVGAAAQAKITPFNSELLPIGGNAKSRYISRRIGLQTVSTGVRLFSVIASGAGTSVDWYIRTSLSSSGVNHDELEWKRLSCPVERNLSSTAGEPYEYLFELNNLSEFDTYDLKCVMLSDNPINTPFIYSYRVIIVA